VHERGGEREGGGVLSSKGGGRGLGFVTIGVQFVDCLVVVTFPEELFPEKCVCVGGRGGELVDSVDVVVDFTRPEVCA